MLTLRRLLRGLLRLGLKTVELELGEPSRGSSLDLKSILLEGGNPAEGQGHDHGQQNKTVHLPVGRKNKNRGKKKKGERNK